MQLQEWFDEQAKVKPSSLQKMSIYQKVLDKSHRSISYNKVSYYTRVALFSFGLLLIAGTAFYSFVPQSGTPYQIAKINDAYMTLNQRDGQFAQADTIGEIFFAEGDIEIIQAQTHIDTTALAENDRVLLAPGAEMHFRVDTNVEAKIMGPAEFVLEDRGLVDGVQQYVINLLAGDYLEVVTLPEEFVFYANPIEKQPIANVIVQAPEFTLEQVDTHGSLDVIISKTDDDKIQIENKGTEVVVKKIIEDKQTFVAVQTNEKIAINGQIEFIAEEVDALIQDIKEKQLTVTYEIDGTDTDKDINDILVTSTTTRKEILDEETMKNFHIAINSTFLSHDLDQMQEYYTAGNQPSFLIAYGNLLAKLQRAHIILNVTYTPVAADITTLPATAQAAQSFATTIESLYYIEPASLQALIMVSTRLTTLIGQTFGGDEVIADDFVNEDTVVESPKGEEVLEEGEEASYEDLLEGLGIE